MKHLFSMDQCVIVVAVSTMQITWVRVHAAEPVLRGVDDSVWGQCPPLPARPVVTLHP